MERKIKQCFIRSCVGRLSVVVVLGPGFLRFFVPLHYFPKSLSKIISFLMIFVSVPLNGFSAAEFGFERHHCCNLNSSAITASSNTSIRWRIPIVFWFIWNSVECCDLPSDAGISVNPSSWIQMCGWKSVVIGFFILLFLLDAPGVGWRFSREEGEEFRHASV